MRAADGLGWEAGKSSRTAAINWDSAGGGEPQRVSKGGWWTDPSFQKITV